MRSGDLDSTDDGQILLRPVGDRSGNDADVHNIQPALEKSRYQLLVKSVATRPVVTADRYLSGHTAVVKEYGICTSYQPRNIGREVLPGYATDIVFAKDRTGQQWLT